MAKGRFMKNFALVLCGLICLSGLALAQAQPPSAPPSDQLSPKVLAEMLRSASTFHDLVQNVNKSLGPDVHTVTPDGVSHHSLERTAVTMGAGAGVGAAIGAMSHNQKGVLIGALVGTAGGLIIDEVVKHREQTRAQAPIDDRPVK